MDQGGNEQFTLQFGLIDGATYSDFDGRRGKYAYDARSGVLVFTSGWFKGLRRLRTDDRVFTVLDAAGARTSFACPWTPKDPRKKHW
ncbi:MAG: hypothetical protein NVSMB19_10450 [Vulcanimicrobiaceae bacterium]